MKFPLLFLSFIFHQCLFSQKSDNNFSIIINATTSVSGSDFLINIYKNKNDIKIVYILRDSVDDSSLEQNKYYKEYQDTLLKLFNNLNENRKTFMLYASKADSLIKQYSYYSKDSIILKAKKKNVTYNNLLKEFFVTPTEKLENKEGNKNRYVFDGTIFKIHLISSEQNRIIYAHSPGAKSHPLLYHLISETLTVYRQNKNNLFLDHKRTSGY